MRRYPEQIATIDRALSIKPDDPETKAARASFTSIGKLTLDLSQDRLMKFARKILRPFKGSPISGFSVRSAERDATAANMALTALGDATFGDSQTQFGAAFGRASRADDEGRNKGALSLRCHASRTGKDRTRAPDFGPLYAFWR